MSGFAPSENNGKKNNEDNAVGIFARIYQENIQDYEGPLISIL